MDNSSNYFFLVMMTYKIRVFEKEREVEREMRVLLGDKDM